MFYRAANISPTRRARAHKRNRVISAGNILLTEKGFGAVAAVAIAFALMSGECAQTDLHLQGMGREGEGGGETNVNRK